MLKLSICITETFPDVSLLQYLFRNLCNLTENLQTPITKIAVRVESDPLQSDLIKVSHYVRVLMFE